MQDPQQLDQALTPIAGAQAVDVFGCRTRHRSCGSSARSPRLGIAKFAVNVCSALPTEIPTNRTTAASAAANFYVCFQTHRKNSPEKSGIELGQQAIVIAYVLYLVPLAGIEPALLAELDFESSASTNSATGASDASRRQGSRSGRNIAGAESGSTGGLAARHAAHTPV